MVLKTCIICGKEFDARGRAKCCSSECTKIKNSNYQKIYSQSEKGKINRRRANKKQRQSDKYKEYQKEYQKKYRKEYRKTGKGKAVQKKYQQSEKGKATNQRYYESHRDELLEYNKEYTQNKIAELNEKYDGDLDLILKDCPNTWLIREAIMLVEYGVSYSEAMYQKMKANPVCEVTGRKDNLVIHHLDSFNTHPELGAELDNLVRVADEVHQQFHNIYGYGNNTREQWNEFVENLNIKEVIL